MFLKNVAEEIDIPPSEYQDAVDRYQSVGRWMEDGEYPDCSEKPGIYPQGSFRLGTVVRPIRDGVEASYGIDLVCELIIPNVYPDILPRVREIGGKIAGDYAHIEQDRMLCLAVPVEERRIFFGEKPSLSGFVNRLVIPYFCSYLYQSNT